MADYDLTEILGLSVAEDTPLYLAHLARKGVPRKALDSVADALQIAPFELAKVLPVSARTLQRYESAERLSPAISDHLLQIAKVLTRAAEVFGDGQLAAAWLKEPSVALGGASPIEYLDTYSGIEMILGELLRTEHGVVS